MMSSADATNDISELMSKDTQSTEELHRKSKISIQVWSTHKRKA